MTTDTSLTFIVDRNNTFAKHKLILTNNNLSTNFVGENRQSQDPIFSIHGRLLDIPDKEELIIMKILAVVSTHNDEDIISSVLEYLRV